MKVNFTKIKELFPFQHKGKFFYTFDLGSDTVKFLVNEIDLENSKLKIWLSHQEALIETSNTQPLTDKYPKYEEAFKKCIEKSSVQIKQKISEAVVVLDGKKCRALTTSLKVTRPTNTEISNQEKNEIIEKLFEGAYEELKEIIESENFDTDPELEVVDFSAVFIDIDGTQVLDLEGESGRVVEVCYTLFFAYSEHLNQVKSILKGLGIKGIHFVPSSLAIVDSIKRIKKNKVDCVILDIGGNFTEGIICFRGGVYLNKTMDFGGCDFTNAISSKLGVSYLNAEKVKRFYSFGKLKEKENLAVQKVILDTVNLWSCGIEDLFQDFKEVKLFASDFYLLGGGSDLPDIKEQLFEEPWTKSIPFKANPVFKQIEIEKLIDLELTEELKTAEELIPILASYYYFCGHRK